MNGQRVGYVRVSTFEQNAVRQLDGIELDRRYLYRAVDKDGNTIDFLLRAHRDKTAARRYFEKSITQNGASKTMTIDKAAHAGVQDFPLCPDPSRRYRIDAHDR